MPKRPNPFEAKVVALSDDGFALSDDDFALLTEAVETRKCRESVGVGDFDEAAAKWRPHPRCPECKSQETSERGRCGSGRQSWECRACGHRFTSLAGTIFESSKKACSHGFSSSASCATTCSSTLRPNSARCRTRPPGNGATGSWRR